LSSRSNEFPAVFLHAGWRCASTYVWSRFRALPQTLCFYEPFGERLAHVSPKRLERDTAHGWDSRHPPLEAPYRAEYAPLLRRFLRGVPGYHESFAVARYFSRDGARREVAYLARLLEHARRRESVPVLGFSRSLGRAAALKTALGGYHIVLRREPRQQWLSCRSYRQSGAAPYFELCHFLILALAEADSPAGRLAASLGLPRVPRRARGFTRQLQALHAALAPWSDEQSYRAFIAVYLLSQAAAAPAADVLLEVDRLGESASYRARVGARILADSGLAVDFADARTPRHDETGAAVDFEGVEADIRARLIECGAELTSGVAACSPAAAAHIQ
jgi:hypothetical protein